MEIVSNAELREFITHLGEKLEAIPRQLARILSDTDPQVYFTKQEAADYLRLSASSLDRFVSQGRLRRVKLGESTSAVLFRREDLDRFVCEHLELDNNAAIDIARQLRAKQSR